MSNPTKIKIAGEYYTIIFEKLSFACVDGDRGYCLYTTSFEDDLFRDEQEIRPLCGRWSFKSKKQAIKMAEQVAERRQQIKTAQVQLKFQEELDAITARFSY